MATATSPAPDDRSTKRQKGDEAGSSQGIPGDGSYGSRPKHPNQMYPGYMGMGGSGPGPYMNGPGMPPYGQYGGPHGGPHGPPPHGGYGGMYNGGSPHVRGRGSPERPGRPSGTSGSSGSWNGYRGHPSGSAGGMGNHDDKDHGSPPQQHPPNHPYSGGWGHPQSWQPGHSYGPSSGYGGHHSVSGGRAYGQGGSQGNWNSNGGPMTPEQPLPPNSRPTAPVDRSSNKSPPRSRPRPESDASVSKQMPQRLENASYCVDVSSVQGGRSSVTQDMGEDGSSVSGSAKDKGRGNYKCGRCGVPKKGHICPYQPKLKRRPDEPPPDTRNAAVQVEMDEFMTLRRLNIRIQGFPESYATEPFLSANMVGAEPHSADPFLSDDHGMMPLDDLHRQPLGDMALKDGGAPLPFRQSPSPKRDHIDDGSPIFKEEITEAMV